MQHVPAVSRIVLRSMTDPRPKLRAENREARIGVSGLEDWS